jgi:hypothetical protein
MRSGTEDFVGLKELICLPINKDVQRMYKEIASCNCTQQKGGIRKTMNEKWAPNGMPMLFVLFISRQVSADKVRPRRVISQWERIDPKGNLKLKI